MKIKTLYYLVLSLFFIYVVFPAIPGAFAVFALSNDPNQHFDPTPTTGGSATTNWAVTHSGGTAYTLTVPGVSPDQDTSDITPATTGQLISAGNCAACSVTLTYTDPSSGTGGTQQYILVDVYTENVGRQLQLVVTDTNSIAVTSASTDLLYNCSTGGTLAGTTKANTWTTIFVDTSSLTTIANVNIIIPAGQAATMNTDPVLFDNLQGASNLPCLIPPTATNTPTATVTDTPTATSTMTDTGTPTDTFTSTGTPTHTATATPTGSPTSTITSTATFTPTLSLTPTPSFTPTLSSTPTNPSTPTSTPTATLSSTPTNSPTNSATETQSFTATSTGTPPATFTFTSTSTVTFTETSTATLIPTNTPLPTSTNTFTFTPSSSPTPTFTFTQTFTPTITFTPTSTNTPGPTSTYTQTPCPVVVYPNPMDFQHIPAYSNNCPSGTACIKFDCVPVGSTLKIYTVSLGLVRNFTATEPSPIFTLDSGLNVGTFHWDGNNGDGNPVSAGFYIYVIDGPGGRTFGKFAISRSWNGS